MNPVRGAMVEQIGRIVALVVCVRLTHAFRRGGSRRLTSFVAFFTGAASRFAILGLVGCEGQDAADWYGDESFTAEERAQIETGATWLYAQAGLPAPRIEWGPVGSAPVARTIRREAYQGNAGFCSGEGGTLYLSPEAAGTALAGLTAHELAHCVLGFEDRYGAEHATSTGIMRVLEPMRWTESEQAQCLASPYCAAR